MSKLSSTQARPVVETATSETVPALSADKDQVRGLPVFEPTVAKLLGSATPTSQSMAEEMLVATAQLAKLPGIVPTRNPINFLDSLIRRVDEVVSSQLNEVMHAAPFLKLEGTWRGLQKLVKETDTNPTLWVEMLNADKDELRQDFANATDYSTSALWKKVYEGKYDQFGGKPFGAFVSGFEFANGAADIDLLKNFMKVGASAQAPFVLSASPQLLGIRSFANLKHLEDLKNTFEGADYTPWRELRKNPDSRFLALTLPRVLARLPYGSKTIPAEGLNYEEAPLNNRGNLAEMPHDHMCWSSSAYAFGTVMTKAFRQTNFCTAIIGSARGKLNGGSVSGLDLYTYENKGGNLETKPPTETVIPGHKEFALAELGLLPLSYELDTATSVFLGGKTMFAPQGKPGSSNFKNDFVASVLPNILPTCRISHYTKAIAHKFNGRFDTSEQLKLFVQNWLANFKTDSNADEAGKTKFPLQDFAVTVKEGWAPGVYDMNVTLKYWQMIYQINADVSMVAELDNRK